MKRTINTKDMLWVATGIAFMLVFVLAGCGGAVSGDTQASSVSSDIPIVVDSATEMGIGDIMFVRMADQDLVIDFAGVEAGTEFMMATGNSSIDASSNFLMSNDLLLDIEKDAVPSTDAFAESGLTSGSSIDASDDYGPQEILSAWLRASERELSEQAKPVPSFSAAKDVASSMAAEVGEVRRFRVLSSLASTAQYATVTATARCVTANIAIFVDDRIGADLLSSDDISGICDEFDDIAGWEFTALGDASDVNSDGVVTVLITPQVNMLGASAGGIVGGYFYAADLYERTLSNPTSDEQEIIYALAPDPDGEYGAMITREFYLSEMLPSVLPHELQHAINFNQHVFVNSGVAEETWLNEGLSHLVEDLVGYGNSNPGRFSLFLSSPSIVSLVTDASPGLAQRGATYLFLRYLYEQAPDGEAFVRSLVNGTLTGIANIEQSFNSSAADFDEFDEFMIRWSAALMLTSQGLGAGSQYAYQERTLDATTENWTGVSLTGDADDGRGTELSGIFTSSYEGYTNTSVASSSAKYFTITDVPERIGIQTTGISDYAVLVRTR
jgi:hypothetical protein